MLRTGRGGLFTLAGAVAAALLFAIPAQADLPGSPTTATTDSKLTVRLKGKGHKITVGNKAKLVGTLTPYAPNETIALSILRGGKVNGKKSLKIRQSKQNPDVGVFSTKTGRMIKPGNYLAEADYSGSSTLKSSQARSGKWKIHYPGLHRGSHGPKVSIYNKLLRKQGYLTSHGSHFRTPTGLASLAYRKVHGMARTMSAPPKAFKTLADGRGGFKLKYPGEGRHVEVDLSRQVMALADHGKAQYTVHISSGKPSTPTVRGTFHFYRKTPGYNSEGMYYSVYFIRGYATHGYTPVPTYPASHGCVRNPITFSHFIYNWIHLGEPINVYG